MRKQYGFTLVELIVAVAILGITAAVTVPALTGYVDKGSEQKAVAEAHTCVTVAESLAAQRLMEGTLAGWADWDGSPPDADLTGFRHAGQGYYVKTGGGQQPAGAGACAEVTQQAETPGTVTQLWCNGDGAVARLVYVTEGYTVVYARAMTKTGILQPAPTPEPVPVSTPSFTPAPTATPTAKPTATPTPKPTPTPTPKPEDGSEHFIITGPYAKVTVTAKPWPTGDGSLAMQAGEFYHQDGRLYFIYADFTWSQQQPPTSGWYSGKVLPILTDSSVLYTETTIGHPNVDAGYSNSDFDTIGPIKGGYLFTYNDRHALYVRGYDATHGQVPEKEPWNWVKVTGAYEIELTIPGTVSLTIRVVDAAGEPVPDVEPVLQGYMTASKGSGLYTLAAFPVDPGGQEGTVGRIGFVGARQVMADGTSQMIRDADYYRWASGSASRGVASAVNEDGTEFRFTATKYQAGGEIALTLVVTHTAHLKEQQAGALEATCLQKKSEAHYHCALCSRYFLTKDDSEVAEGGWEGQLGSHQYAFYGKFEKSDETNHWHQCAVCGRRFDEQPHQMPAGWSQHSQNGQLLYEYRICTDWRCDYEERRYPG